MSTNYIEKVKRMNSSSWVGYWPLNEESGTTVFNAVTPSVTPITTTPAQNGTSANLVRKPGTAGFLSPDGGVCAQFDGSTTYIDMIDALSSSATTVGTMAIWAATPQANLKGTTKMNVWLFAVDGNNVLNLAFDTTAYRYRVAHIGNTSSKTSNSSLVYNVDGGQQDPEWHHFAMTYADGGTLRFYVDGVAQTAATTIGTWSGTFNSAKMVLGSDNTSINDPFKGWMSHFVWSNVEFTAAEVKELATAGP